MSGKLACPRGVATMMTLTSSPTFDPTRATPRGGYDNELTSWGRAEKPMAIPWDGYDNASQGWCS